MAEDADTPKTQPKNRTVPRWELEYVLLWVVLGLGAVIVAHKAHDEWFARQVASRQPIGAVVGMSGGGRQTVLETETGFYPLSEPLAATKGTPLVLEIRGNGDRYVCDLAGTMCSRTSRQGFAGKRLGLGS